MSGKLSSSEAGSRRTLLLLCLAIGAAYLLALVWTEGLHQAPYKDEVHNWETSNMFLDFRFPPTVDELRSYPEVITPLSFIVWSQLERATGLGIFAGRLLDFLLSMGVLGLIALHGRPRRMPNTPPDESARTTPLLAAFGLLLYPYFLPLSVHLYTDMIAVFLGLVGFALYADRRLVASTIFLSLAIATRQYMLALPTALAAWALIEQLQNQRGDPRRWIAPACASGTIFFWFTIFGGLGPPSGVDKWVPLYPAPMMEFFQFIPEYGLYFLTLVGAYFVLPEFVLFRRWRDMQPPSTLRVASAAIVLGVAYLAFPPNTAIVPMGALDRVVRPWASNDLVRMGIFYLLALCTCLRFRHIDMAFWLLAVTFMMDMKAQLAWDKYALPPLTVLWYLKSIRALDGGRFPMARRPSERL